MKNSEVLTQLAEATELLNMLEHLASAYHKQQGRGTNSGQSVAWQGLRFNLLECKKRVLSAKRLLAENNEFSSAHTPTTLVDDLERDLDSTFDANPENTLEARSGSEEERVRELSPLARRIRRAPTSAALATDGVLRSSTARGRTREREIVGQAADSGGSLRELRPLTGVTGDIEQGNRLGNGAQANRVSD